MCLRIALVLLTIATPVGAQESTEEPLVFVVVQGGVSGVSAERLELAVNEHALVFTDRPVRSVRHVGTERYLTAAWGPAGFFLADPPNASLVGAKGTVAIVEVTAASWSEGSVTFELALLEGDLPTSGDRVALTIDGIVQCCIFGTCADPGICR
jgi:hypothetical protein